MKKFDYIIVIAVIGLCTYMIAHFLNRQPTPQNPSWYFAETEEVKESPDLWCLNNPTQCKG